MTKVYLTKIIANDNEGLQMISACCAGAKVKVSDIKFLRSSSSYSGLTRLDLIVNKKFIVKDNIKKDEQIFFKNLI